MNPATSTSENAYYLGNIIDDSVLKCDEIMKVTKTAPVKTVPTKTITTKTKPTKIFQQILAKKKIPVK